jgi:uncharacterized membrane protein (DUF373 family)
VRVPIVHMMRVLVGWLERALAAILVVLILLAVIGLGVETFRAIEGHGYLEGEELLVLVESVLSIFVLIELFSIAIAYMRGKSVVRTVLEASLVAVARKLVAFEPREQALGKGAALAALFLAISTGWFLLARIGIGAEPEPPQE